MTRLIAAFLMFAFVSPANATPSSAVVKAYGHKHLTSEWPILSLKRSTRGALLVRTKLVAPEDVMRRVRRRGWLRHFPKKPSSATVTVSVYSPDEDNPHGRVVVDLVGFSGANATGRLVGGATTTTFRLGFRLRLPKNDRRLVKILLNEFVVPHGELLVGRKS